MNMKRALLTIAVRHWLGVAVYTCPLYCVPMLRRLMFAVYGPTSSAPGWPWLGSATGRRRVSLLPSSTLALVFFHV